MRILTRENVVGDTDLLLYDILQELKGINAALTKGSTPANAQAATSGYPCKSCNGTHENKGQLLACARKKKKEGA